MLLLWCEEAGLRPSSQVEDEAASAPSHWVLVKGAPEVVQPFLARPPAAYTPAYKQYAAQGGRCRPSSPRLERPLRVCSDPYCGA